MSFIYHLCNNKIIHRKPSLTVQFAEGRCFRIAFEAVRGSQANHFVAYRVLYLMKHNVCTHKKKGPVADIQKEKRKWGEPLERKE